MADLQFLNALHLHECALVEQSLEALRGAHPGSSHSLSSEDLGESHLALLKRSKVTKDATDVGALIRLAAALERTGVCTQARVRRDLVVRRVVDLGVVLVVVLGRRRRVLFDGLDEGENGLLRGRKANIRHRRGWLVSLVSSLLLVVVDNFVEAKKIKIIPEDRSGVFITHATSTLPAGCRGV